MAVADARVHVQIWSLEIVQGLRHHVQGTRVFELTVIHSVTDDGQRLDTVTANGHGTAQRARCPVQTPVGVLLVKMLTVLGHLGLRGKAVICKLPQQQLVPDADITFGMG